VQASYEERAVPKVLLIDPALAVAMDRFRQMLPASVEIAATTSFADDEPARLAVDPILPQPGQGINETGSD
jgi:hypothetical protein